MNEAVPYQKEGGCKKYPGSHHVRESAKKSKVPPKLRALKSMCHNKGAVTKKSCHIKLELGV